MQTNNPRSCLIRAVQVIILLALAALPREAAAIPYASGITNNAGTISFFLNEPAPSVVVVFDGGARTDDLGALTKGVHSFNLGANTSFEIVVSKASAPVWTLISDDSSALMQFNSPRGVAVNLNPTNLALFGRVYVANSAVGATGTGRSVGDGIYVLNADQSDAVGQGNAALTAGLNFISTAGAAQDANSPWHIEVGSDNNLYIADFSSDLGTIYLTDPDVSAGSGLLVLDGQGTLGNPTVHTRVGGSPIAHGALVEGNLTVHATDGGFFGGRANRLLRWDIGSGPFPHSGAPVELASPLISSVANVTTDIDQAPDGKFYMMQNRSAGNESGLVVVDTDGLTVLWSSLSESRSISNNPSAVDILRISRAVKVSPDNRKVALIRDDLQTWVIPLTDGIPDLAARELVITYSGAPTTLGRDVSWDAAGNLYALSSGNQLLRVFSPGGTTVARTGSDGTFSVLLPPDVTVSATDPLASESGLDTATFTITRAGLTDAPLTVFYSLSGTAKNGFDYETNVLSVIIPVGAASADVVIMPIDDSESEFQESVILTLQPTAEYNVGSPGSASALILDNDPQSFIITATDTNMYEGFASDTVSFTVTRLGETNADAFSLELIPGGTATPGSDYLPPPLNFAIPAGVITTNVVISVIDDHDYEGDETIVLQIGPGSGDYLVGSPSSATAWIRDNEYPPGTVVFSDDFDTDTSANWTAQFGANNGIYDATVTFAFDYSANGIPPAPHSVDGSQKGLFVAVNKTEGTLGGSAGINLYPNGQNFSGDYALRFDMFLQFGGVSTTEHGLAGINHSGLLTNRVTQSADANSTTIGGDGLWFAIEGDGSANREYGVYTVTSAASLPTLITNRSAAALALLLPSPPYFSAGSPGNLDISTTKTWADVEIRQEGNLVTLKINQNVIYRITNTTGFASGNIMIGHNDQFDSVGSANNFAIFDNVRVISFGAPPAIVQQPQSQTVAAGDDATFSVVADSTSPLSYQWRKNGTDIPGATAASLTLTNAQPADAGDYTVFVINSTGLTPSATATLRVLAPPSITTPPQSRTVVQGSNVTFTVVADGALPFAYQWRKNGVDITGATNATLTLTNVQVADEGDYVVIVGNEVGSATSFAATLRVNVPPSITTPPQSQTVVQGSNVTFTVIADGTPPPTYQWRKNGVDISDATNATLTLTNVQVADEGNYTAVVANQAGSATSLAAALRVNVPPTITMQPQSVTTNAGGNVTFSVTADGTQPLTYQWRKDGNDIANATNATLNLTNVQTSDEGSYTVLVGNGAGSVASAAALLLVNVPPTIANGAAGTPPSKSGDSFSLSFQSQVGRNYLLEYKDSVDAALWTTVPIAPVPGTGGEITITDPNATVPMRFYRVLIQ